MFEFRLLAWIIEKLAVRAVGSAVDGEHQEPDEEDWTWDTDLAETRTTLPTAEVPRFFEMLTVLFDRGFGPPQIAIIRNHCSKVRFQEGREMNFNPARKGSPVTLQILLFRSTPDDFVVSVMSSQAIVTAIEELVARLESAEEDESD